MCLHLTNNQTQKHPTDSNAANYAI